MSSDILALLGIIISPILGVAAGMFTIRAQNRKLHAEACKTEQEAENVQDESLRQTNAQLVQDNQRLRENLRQFDDEFKNIRIEMATMRREHDAEIATMRREYDAKMATMRREYDAEIAQMRADQRRFEKERRVLYDGVKLLIRQLAENGLEPCWAPQEEGEKVG